MTTSIGLAPGDEVVEDHVRKAERHPGVLVAPGPVQEIEDGGTLDSRDERLQDISRRDNLLLRFWVI